MYTATFNTFKPLITLSSQPGTAKIGGRLDRSRAQVFRKQIYPGLPVEELAGEYCRNNGAPSKNLNTMPGLMVVQELMDLTDEQALDSLAFDVRVQRALNIDDATDRNVCCA
ncbi:MAG: hypothetical protein LBW85_04780, partial [Deltaproteobacteria bacterium]|nr:hypothetical protein [Deltaproteobacteria bacterium]